MRLCRKPPFQSTWRDLTPPQRSSVLYRSRCTTKGGQLFSASHRQHLRSTFWKLDVPPVVNPSACESVLMSLPPLLTALRPSVVAMADSSQRSAPGGGAGGGGAAGGMGGGGEGGGYATSLFASAARSTPGVTMLLASRLGRQLYSSSSRSNSDHHRHTLEVPALHGPSSDECTNAPAMSSSIHASTWPSRSAKRA